MGIATAIGAILAAMGKAAGAAGPALQSVLDILRGF